MAEKYFLGAYWGARRETVEQCAVRLQRFLWQLGQFEPSLEAWFERGRSRREALTSKIDPDSLGALERLVRKGQNKRDMTGEVIGELGYQIGIWNGQTDDRAAGLSIKCGLYWQSAHPHVRLSNAVALDLPDELGALADAQNMAGLLALVANVWQPSWGGVMSQSAMTARKFNAGAPFVDWMVYVPKEISGVAAPSSVVAVPDLGSILISQERPPVQDDEDSMRNIGRIESLLKGL